MSNPNIFDELQKKYSAHIFDAALMARNALVPASCFSPALAPPATRASASRAAAATQTAQPSRYSLAGLHFLFFHFFTGSR